MAALNPRILYVIAACISASVFLVNPGSSEWSGFQLARNIACARLSVSARVPPDKRFFSAERSIEIGPLYKSLLRPGRQMPCLHKRLILLLRQGALFYQYLEAG